MLQIKRSLKNNCYRVTAPGEHLIAACVTVAEVQTAVAHYYGQDHNRAVCPICRLVVRLDHLPVRSVTDESLQ